MSDPIMIEQVANGFIVNLASLDRATCISRNSAHVFESMESLQKYISQYFEPVQKMANRD